MYIGEIISLLLWLILHIY